VEKVCVISLFKVLFMASKEQGSPHASRGCAHSSATMLVPVGIRKLEHVTFHNEFQGTEYMYQNHRAKFFKGFISVNVSVYCHGVAGEQ